MARINRDTVVAILLLLLCGAFYAASFDIRKTNYGTPGSELWPRIILAFLFLLSLGYLVQSLRREATEGARPGSLKAWLAKYRNALWCYALFTLFLLTLPYLGMLAGGGLFVFATLTALGPRHGLAHLVHAAVAAVSVGLMWAVFTYGLNVFLPRGELFAGW